VGVRPLPGVVHDLMAARIWGHPRRAGRRRVSHAGRQGLHVSDLVVIGRSNGTLSSDVTTALRERDSATLDEHCCAFAA
jgi:hypothetical protein